MSMTGNVTSAVYRVEYDFSGNGLPDLWELDHFGGFTQSPRADSDGDGVSNLDEYLEQTDPTNAASFHARIILSATAGGTVQVKPFKPFYDLGETVQLTATPNPGGSFDGWTGDVTGNERQRSVVLNRSVQVTGVFGIPILTDGLSAVGNLLASTTNRYAFSAQAGETFILTMANLSETNSSFRPLIRVQDPYGSAIASQVAAPVAVVMQRATTNGVFTVIVESQNLNSEGAYRLAFAKVPHTFELESPGRGEFLTNAVPAIGALTYGGLNLWAFNAKAGDEINLRCGVMQSQRGVFAPDMFVFDPTGELVTHVNGAEEVFSRLTAGTSGRFTVLLKSYFFNPPFLLLDGAGTYRLSFIRVPDPELLATEVSVPFLINGSKVQAVTGLGDVALWLFVANAGDKIVLRSGALSGGFSYRTRLRLFGPDGRSIAEGGSNGDFESYIFQNITTTGVFYLLVDSASLNATGTYTLNYARIPGPYSVGEGDEGGRMSAGQIYFGVNDVADLDLWSFEAVQGRPISLTIQRTSTDPFYDPVLTLFAPTGEVLSSEVFSSIAITPKVSGTYTALVQANRRASVGRYRIFGEGFFSGVRLGSPHIDGPRLTVSGTGGFSDGTFRLMMTTHLNDRLDGWVPVLTNQFDGLGAFQLTIPFLPSLPEQYFKVTVP